jgi:hypothetical protein
MNHPEPDAVVDWLRDALATSGYSQAALSRALCSRTNRLEDFTIINKVLAGRRKLRYDEIVTISAITSFPPPSTVARHLRVPLVGYVEAGAKITILNKTGQGEYFEELTPMPDGGTIQTVALEIKDDALGAVFEGWLAYFNDRKSPPKADAGRKLHAVGLADGAMYLRKIAPGTMPGRFNLWGNFGAPIFDAEVAWAEPIFAMLPKPDD